MVELQEHELVKEISKVMLILGTPAHLKGYEYLRSAIVKTVQKPEVVTSVTKLLYPDLAKEFKTTNSKIERAIRNAIEVSWERGEIKLQEELWGYSRLDNSYNRPTNSEFIAVLSDSIRLKFK